MAAPTYDSSASTSSAAGVTSLTTASWTIAGSTRYLVGGIASSAGTVVDPAGMKWGGSGGTDLTKKGATVTVNVFARVSMYGLVAPSASTTTLYGSWGSTQDETMIGGISVNGVDQATPEGTQATATGTNSNPTVNVTTEVDDFVVDVMMTFDNNFAGGRTITAGAGQTKRQEQLNIGNADCFGMSTEVATGASTTMSWTISDTSNNNWGILALPLKPDTGGGGGGGGNYGGRINPRPVRQRPFAPGLAR